MDIEKAKRDLAYFIEACCTVDGKPVKLTAYQRQFIEKLESMKPGERLSIFNRRY